MRRHARIRSHSTGVKNLRGEARGGLRNRELEESRPSERRYNTKLQRCVWRRRYLHECGVVARFILDKRCDATIIEMGSGDSVAMRMTYVISAVRDTINHEFQCVMLSHRRLAVLDRNSSKHHRGRSRNDQQNQESSS